MSEYFFFYITMLFLTRCRESVEFIDGHKILCIISVRQIRFRITNNMSHKISTRLRNTCSSGILTFCLIAVHRRGVNAIDALQILRDFSFYHDSAIINEYVE